MPKKGYKHPPDCEHCALLRIRMKGNTLTLGKKMPESHRESARQRSIGNKYASREWTEEQKQARGELSKRIHAEHPEIAQAQSERMKGNQHTLGWAPPDEWRQKQSLLKKEHWASLSDEEREELSRKLAGIWTDKLREKRSLISKELWSNDDYREMMRASSNNPERREKFVQSMAKYWNDPEWLKELGEKTMAAMPPLWPNPTRIERILEAMVRDAFAEWPVQVAYIVGGWKLDVAVPDLKLDFEADGEYWHGLERVVEKDARRDIDLAARGWTVVRFGERDLHAYAKALNLPL